MCDYSISKSNPPMPNNSPCITLMNRPFNHSLSRLITQLQFNFVSKIWTKSTLTQLSGITQVRILIQSRRWCIWLYSNCGYRRSWTYLNYSEKVRRNYESIESRIIIYEGQRQRNHWTSINYERGDALHLAKIYSTIGNNINFHDCHKLFYYFQNQTSFKEKKINLTHKYSFNYCYTICNNYEWRGEFFWKVVLKKVASPSDDPLCSNHLRHRRHYLPHIWHYHH